jgi:uncharacterized protein YhhL (DUF1145 family)
VITATAIVSIVVFFCSLHLSGVVRVSTGVLVIVHGAFATMRNSSLDDETREKELQKASVKLFGSFISILCRSALTLLISFLPIYLASLIGFVKIKDVIYFLSRWDVIASASIVIVAGYIIRNRLQPSSIEGFQVNYSVMDRLLHWIAFAVPTIQLLAADIEKKVFGAVYENVEAKRPIFITSLPRAGTTLMLEALHRLPSLATHTYRDMPFVLAPIFWSKLSSPFRKRTEMTERAHGDGMQLGYDSPEAFEEILWRTFWPEKYNETSIAIWGANDYKDEAGAFFNEHFKKIIALRRPDRSRDGRYISKNNCNIARLDLICRMFPDAKIIVPVRNPIKHATSLFRQHCNFIEMHKKESFVRRYMDDIGHYEFGDLHRPIAFSRNDNLFSGRDPLKVDYWLAYWIAAFEHVFERRDKVMLISYEATCLDAKNMLADICAQLEIPEEGMLDMVAKLFNAPSPVRDEKAYFDFKLLDRAEELHNALFAP